MIPLAPKPIPHRLLDWKYLRPPCHNYAYFTAHSHRPLCTAEECTPEVVTWLADTALLAYADPKFADPIYEQAGLKARFLAGPSTHAYIAENDSTVIASFRGTQINDPVEFLRDLRTNFSFRPRPCPGVPGKVHAGFALALEEIWADSSTILEDAARRGKSIWLTGHSLGGALATLAAVRFTGTIAGVCVFAAPRVGDADFAAAADMLNLVRLVFADDRVPRLPPRRLGFVHAGERRLIARDGAIKTQPEPTRLYKAESLEALLANWATAARLNLFDHSPVLYATHAYNAFVNAFNNASRTL